MRIIYGPQMAPRSPRRVDAKNHVCVCERGTLVALPNTHWAGTGDPRTVERTRTAAAIDERHTLRATRTATDRRCDAKDARVSVCVCVWLYSGPASRPRLQSIT